MRRPWVRRAGALGVLLALMANPTPSHAVDLLEEMEQNGPSENRIDLVITGDGYTAAQADLFRQHSEALAEGLFGQTPWAGYRGLFNIHRVVTESVESGADHPSSGVYVDTYFDAQFDYYGIERLTYANEGKILQVVSGLVPEVDQVVLIINDTTYGGSGGSVAMASVHPDAVFILVHELSHSTGHLADEYTDPYPGYPTGDPEPNVDVDSTFADIKWNVWIEAGTPLPTGMASATSDYLPVGAYEGARYQTTGIFRSAPHCLMQSLAYEPCDVCREAVVLGYYSDVDPLDEVSPVVVEVVVDLGRPDLLPVNFTASAVEPEPGTPLEVVWTVDDQEVHRGPSFALDPTALELQVGQHTLVARALDDTPWVRQDPDGLLESTRSWTITVQGTTADAGVPDGGSPDAGAGDGGTHPPPGGGRPCGCEASSAEEWPMALILAFGIAAWVRRRRRSAGRRSGAER